MCIVKGRKVSREIISSAEQGYPFEIFVFGFLWV